jgi:hypothetical protein
MAISNDPVSTGIPLAFFSMSQAATDNQFADSTNTHLAKNSPCHSKTNHHQSKGIRMREHLFLGPRERSRLCQQQNGLDGHKKKMKQKPWQPSNTCEFFSLDSFL